MSVRKATLADEAPLFWLLLNDLDADNSLGFKPSDKRVYEHVHSCCSGESGVAGVIEATDGSIIGSIGIECAQPWHSNDWFLIQVWQFVLPEHRHGTTHGEDLFAFAEGFRRHMAKGAGHDMILELSVMSHHRLDAKTRLWRRHGKQIGALFWSGGNEQVN